MKIYGKGKHCNKIKNEYIIGEEYTTLIIANGKTFKIDTEDIEKTSKYIWNNNKKGYAQTGNEKETYLQLHRYIMNCKKGDGKIIDHINRDITDNRKSNLRVVTKQENNFNRNVRKDSKSGFRGVYHRPNKGGKWYADIKVNYKTIHLGAFDTFEQAKKTRLEAEEKYFKIKGDK